jgi:branched-chain amino acid transport system permease protein
MFKLSAKRVVGILILIVMIILPLFVRNPYLLTVFIVALYVSYMSLCWNLVFGYAGQFSLCHQVFLGVGAYTSTMLAQKWGVTPWIGMFAGGILATCFSLFISFACFRYRIYGFFFVVVTITFAEVIHTLTLKWGFINRGIGIFLPVRNSPIDFAFTSRIPFYYVILVMVLMAVIITYLISRSKLGYYLVAIRDDEDAAMALGVNAARYKTIIMAISAFLTAFGGTFYAQFFLYINPDVVFSVAQVIQMLFGALVGGAGTIFGPIIGAAGFSFLGEVLRSLPFGVREAGAVSLILYGIILMLVVLFMPEGIIKLPERIGIQHWFRKS